MARFRPQITYTTNDSQRDYRNNQRKRPYIVEDFDTYRELKKALPRILAENIEVHASVCRSRLGEWGEWFEHWELGNGVPVITKQGWN